MATLKISDLSVGDWVRYRDRICQIAEIHQLSYNFGSKEICSFPQVTLYYEDDMPTYQESVPFKDIHPIPITAEILGRNGFGKKTFTQDQLFRIVEPNGNMPFIGYRWDSRRVIIERDNDYMLRVKAEYIHQLQHALRLAGVDKLIVEL
jgi:hypothetical protein